MTNTLKVVKKLDSHDRNVFYLFENKNIYKKFQIENEKSKFETFTCTKLPHLLSK